MRDYSNLLLKVKYLYAKSDYQHEAFRQAKIDFEEYANKFCEENGIDLKEPQRSSDETALEVVKEQNDYDEEVETSSTQAKKLFRKVAMMTHPDKLTGLSEYEVARREELFRRAREAVENGKWYALVDVAQSLGIEIPEPDKEQYNMIIQEIEDLEDDIRRIETSFAWILHNLKTDEQKDALMKLYLKNFGVDLDKE